MENNKNIRTRLAPSPTGFVHLGTLRTGLFGFLLARHYGGVNILRVEDTDQSRKVDGAVENLLTSMATLGVEFDEGVYFENGEIKQKGDYGPYIQSERLDIYQKYANQLLESKKAYYCFCSSERLTELRAEQVALKKAPMYDGKCRDLDKEQLDSQLELFKKENKSPVIRQAINHEGKTVIDDLVFGKIEYDNAILDDQILMKSDGFPTYHLAVVVDDHLMEITHVIRGDEWIPSTPKHLQLYQSFGWEPPKFAHLPLILNPDKSKLSKRQGDVSVEDFLQKGYLPEALINFIALLGWNPKTEQEIFSMDELIQNFELSKVNKSGAVFDRDKLNWMNAQYIKTKPNSEIISLIAPHLKTIGIDLEKFEPEFIDAMIEIEKERLDNISDITEGTEFYFNDPEYDPDLLVWKKSTKEDAVLKLKALYKFYEDLPKEEFDSSEKMTDTLRSWIKENDYDNGSVLWPLRVSLTGLAKSPGPFEISRVLYLGYVKEAILRRIKTAIEKLST